MESSIPIVLVRVPLLSPSPFISSAALDVDVDEAVVVRVAVAQLRLTGPMLAHVFADFGDLLRYEREEARGGGGRLRVGYGDGG